MKLRIDKDLHDEARHCADAVGDTLTDWVAGVCRLRLTGRLPRVADLRKAANATRAQSCVITIGECRLSPAEIRLAIAEAIDYCRKHAPPPFDPQTVYQGDYIIAPEDS
jgi:hypothetical protein